MVGRLMGQRSLHFFGGDIPLQFPLEASDETLLLSEILLQGIDIRFGPIGFPEGVSKLVALLSVFSRWTRWGGWMADGRHL